MISHAEQHQYGGPFPVVVSGGHVMRGRRGRFARLAAALVLDFFERTAADMLTLAVCIVRGGKSLDIPTFRHSTFAGIVRSRTSANGRPERSVGRMENSLPLDFPSSRLITEIAGHTGVQRRMRCSSCGSKEARIIAVAGSRPARRSEISVLGAISALAHATPLNPSYTSQRIAFRRPVPPVCFTQLVSDTSCSNNPSEGRCRG